LTILAKKFYPGKTWNSPVAAEGLNGIVHRLPDCPVKKPSIYALLIGFFIDLSIGLLKNKLVHITDLTLDREPRVRNVLRKHASLSTSNDLQWSPISKSKFDFG
jgi:hypothetical protein